TEDDIVDRQVHTRVAQRPGYGGEHRRRQIGDGESGEPVTGRADGGAPGGDDNGVEVHTSKSFNRPRAIFPAAVVGISRTGTQRRGIASRVSSPRARRRTSSISAPSNWTAAVTVSPNTAWGLPITAATATPSIPPSTRSTSSATTVVPPTLITASPRPCTRNSPSAPSSAISPTQNHSGAPSTVYGDRTCSSPSRTRVSTAGSTRRGAGTARAATS